MQNETPSDLIPLAEATRLKPSPRPGRRTHVATLRRLVRLGQLSGWRIGRWLYVSAAEVKRLNEPRREPIRRPVLNEKPRTKAERRYTKRLLDRAGI